MTWFEAYKKGRERKEKLEYETSYQPKTLKTKEEVSVKWDKYYNFMMQPRALAQVAVKFVEKEKGEKTMTKIEFVKNELNTIAKSLGVKVFINDLPEDRYPDIEYLFFNPNGNRTHLGYIKADELISGWVGPLSDSIYNSIVAVKSYTSYHAALQSFKYADATSKIASKPAIPKIKDVKFNGPATIIFWSDDTKSVVKAQNEEFDPEKGIAMAIARKALGNKHNYFDIIEKYAKKYYKANKKETAEFTMELKGDPLADIAESMKNAFCPHEVTFEFNIKEKD